MPLEAQTTQARKELRFMASFIGAPTLTDEQDAFREAYAARVQECTEAGRQAGLTPAAEDHARVAVVLVDYQHDFVDPTGTLSVPGAQEDIARFLRWFYASAPGITSLYASLDTHLPYQIFFSAWWHNPRTGEHPQPFTPISAAEVNSGHWAPLFQPEWSIYYVNKLAEQARKDLMIWPHHTMQGTLGHMLVAPLSEAIAWHSAARGTQPIYIAKGLTARTEFYGIFGAEVADPTDPASKLNSTLLDAVMEHERVYIAGEAKSHCVLETARQLVAHLSHRPELLARLHILSDCTSSVQHPAVDFDALAEQELARMQQQGVRIVGSKDIVH
jgi:nicotinamidase/pyrazinamidase